MLDGYIVVYCQRKISCIVTYCKINIHVISCIYLHKYTTNSTDQVKDLPKKWINFIYQMKLIFIFIWCIFFRGSLFNLNQESQLFHGYIYLMLPSIILWLYVPNSFFNYYSICYKIGKKIGQIGTNWN